MLVSLGFPQIDCELVKFMCLNLLSDFVIHRYVSQAFNASRPSEAPLYFTRVLRNRFLYASLTLFHYVLLFITSMFALFYLFWFLNSLFT
jgi:hypothetical protein